MGTRWKVGRHKLTTAEQKWATALIPVKERAMVSERIQIEGTVVAANERGFQLQGEEKWCNWSKYAVEPRNLPAPGHAIRATLDGQGFVRKVALLPGSKRIAVEKAHPETMQPVGQNTVNNGRTVPSSGVFVASQPAMHANREFRLKCLRLVLDNAPALTEILDSDSTLLDLADAVAAWAEERE